MSRQASFVHASRMRVPRKRWFGSQCSHELLKSARMISVLKLRTGESG